MLNFNTSTQIPFKMSMSVAPSDKWWAHAGRNDDFPDFTLIDTADAESEVQGAAVD